MCHVQNKSYACITAVKYRSDLLMNIYNSVERESFSVCAGISNEPQKYPTSRRDIRRAAGILEKPQGHPTSRRDTRRAAGIPDEPQGYPTSRRDTRRAAGIPDEPLDSIKPI